MHICISWASLVLSSKESACNARDVGDMNSILESGRFPGEGNDNRLPISCLENRRDRGEWWAAVHRAGKNQTQLSDCTHTHTHISINIQMEIKVMMINGKLKLAVLFL